jgi:hypothetical protein
MAALPHLSYRRERGAALIIVLAFVVLLTGLMVAYLSRTTTDRQVAQVSLNQTKVDQLAASGMDLVIGGLRQEITGPSPTPTPPYVPATNARMLPLRSGNPAGVPDPIPNLVRRSVHADPIAPPGISSFASTVNSTTDASANGRSITLARWNKHYLIPRDPALYGGANANKVGTDPDPSFVAPDWVILTRNGVAAFSAWDPTLADQTPTNNSYAVGRFAYAIYDEGQLLDANVAGYPTGTTADQAGRKGPVAFADLTTLPNPLPQTTQIDQIVGWRNYGSALLGQSNATIAAFGTFPNFIFTAALATNYVNNFVLFNTTGFSTTSGAAAANGRTDQTFLSRQQLIAYRSTAGFTQDALQYLTTFSRELNAPSWKPSTPVGSSIDYAALANTPTASTSTAINRDLLNVRAVGAFTRADGSSAAAGDLLITRRFPLSRINGLGPTGLVTTDSGGNPLYSTINNGLLIQATDPNNGGGTISRDFGLHWNTDHWDYVGATGTTVQNTIATLDLVAGQNREPNFFELLKAGILSGSVGLGSGGTNTFVAAETKYYSNPLSSDYQIFQIGANIINQWNSGNIPIFFNFGGNELAGIKNLPYLNKLVFKPAWTGPKSGTYTFDAWLIPSLWNPHQNAPPASQNIQIAMTSGTFSATSAPVTTSPLTGSASLSMTVDASKFGTVAPGNPSVNNPSAPTAASIVKPPNPPSTITLSTDAAPGPYYGFHVTGTTTTAPTASTTAQPNITACTFQLQVDVTGKGNWKAYQTWTAQPATTLVCAPSGWTGVTNLQDPEFVTLDPRTLRFGVWGNAANQSAVATDFTTGVLTTLDQSVGSPPATGVFEKITALPPNGTGFSTPASTDLYKYANNVAADPVHYTDLDGLQRQGDLLTTGMQTAMQPVDFADRPRILNRPFQSVAELGQVFRDQPWKTLDFGDFVSTTVPGADAGLLDVFTLHESANEAGKTSLNTRYKFILTAILSNATKSLTNTATVITAAQRDAIVTDLFNITSAQPMIRKTDLLTQLAADPNVTSLGNKEARELVIRAFSDACQTRTWNLLIDVIAQSGRYPLNAGSGPNTTNPLANFLVEGEQHYWVHVAIDRFTGQVVDKQIEVVNE